MSAPGMQDDVADKIGKILALAGNNPNENEINAALGKARAMLAAYGLSLDEFQQAHTGNGNAEATELDPVANDSIGVVKSTDSWAYTLARGVGKLTDCTPVFWGHASGGKRIVIAGTVVDMAVARELFGYLYDAAVRLSIDAIRKECPAYYDRGQKTVWRRTFLSGFAARIWQRACDARKQEKAAAIEAIEAQPAEQIGCVTANLPAVRWNAIVQRKESAVSSYVEAMQKRMGLRSGRSSQRRDSGGYASGYAAGANVGLAARRLIR